MHTTRWVGSQSATRSCCSTGWGHTHLGWEKSLTKWHYHRQLKRFDGEAERRKGKRRGKEEGGFSKIQDVVADTGEDATPYHSVKGLPVLTLFGSESGVVFHSTTWRNGHKSVRIGPPACKGGLFSRTAPQLTLKCVSEWVSVLRLLHGLVPILLLSLFLSLRLPPLVSSSSCVLGPRRWWRSSVILWGACQRRLWWRTESVVAAVFDTLRATSLLAFTCYPHMVRGLLLEEVEKRQHLARSPNLPLFPADICCSSVGSWFVLDPHSFWMEPPGV